VDSVIGRLPLAWDKERLQELLLVELGIYLYIFKRISNHYHFSDLKNMYKYIINIFHYLGTHVDEMDPSLKKPKYLSTYCIATSKCKLEILNNITNHKKLYLENFNP